MYDTTYILLYTANLAFILTNLYGWVLKWFYRPRAYDEHFHELFPAQHSVGLLYLLQVFELPYLVQVGNDNALLYVNAFAILIFPLQMLVMCEGYFFPRIRHQHKDYWLFIPAVVVLLPLLLQAIRLISLPEGYRSWVIGIVSLIFAFYFSLSLKMALSIGRAIKHVNEATYADSDDFPTHFARIIQWVPTAICVLMAINFYADDPWVKAVRDVVFTFVNIWFCVFTLNPWRKVFTPLEEDIIEQMDQIGNVVNRLSDDRFNELSQRLEELLNKERIFTEPHITIDTLSQHLGTNGKYLSEVIHRSGYQSFYDMICQHRVRHAISLINQRPCERLHIIAEECGFSSQASMSKAFKSQGKDSPSKYKRS
ncbi:MAG: AraC family transcriptional regulator [Bacteroidaceae bacterium]|nr:AraC family transcriptional regulator [Bacteroidaceae bacterium]MBR1542466.1 AraC family transcriptional regulator [Bacteroidaceae bacterium]